MKSIPHRLTGQSGLTYVAHIACRAGTGHAGHDVAVAFLDEEGEWRGYREASPHPGPERATLALMQAILIAVAERSPRHYVHFYPSDSDLALAYRAALGTPDTVAPLFDGPEWAALQAAYRDQRCGIGVLGGKGTSTGSRAAFILLDSEDAATDVRGSHEPTPPQIEQPATEPPDYDVPF